jgi:hypothetical protein
MSSAPLYDSIGTGYTVTRRTEPRIAAQVWAALGDARTVLNVGAGTGSYEPAGRPPVTELAAAIGARLEPVPVPWDCADGFYHAYWRRPGAYLDEDVRRGMSIWARVGRDAEGRAVRGLRDDLASGRWAERNRDLAGLDVAELGLRLLIA